MPKVDAVEVSNRHRPAAGGGGQLLKMADDMHSHGLVRRDRPKANAPGKLAIIDLPLHSVNERLVVASRSLHLSAPARRFNRGT